MKEYILAIDQGTTSSRAIIFDSKGHSHFILLKKKNLVKNFPKKDGWV